MKVTAIIGFCVVSAVLLKAVERESSEIKLVGVLFCVCTVLYYGLTLVMDIADTFEPLIDSAGIDSEYFEILMKALGIAYLTSAAEEYCRQCGEGALASAAALIGRLGMIAVSLPLMRAAGDMVGGLVK